MSRPTDLVTTAAAGPRERQERIRNQVVSDGSVRIEELAEAHGVSLMTIHRDLDELERQGWLRKVRGAATAEPSAVFHGDVRHRLGTLTDAKREIAASAAHLVRRGDAVMLDESTTAYRVAELLPGRGPLTVITNFLAVVRLLAGETGIDLIALGGAYYPAYDAFLGMNASEAARPLRADLLLMSTTAITDGACWHQSQDTILVKRELMAASARRVLLVDHSKFAKRSLHQLCPLTDFDLIVVDAATSRADLQGVRDLGVPLHVAGTEGDDGREMLDTFLSARVL